MLHQFYPDYEADSAYGIDYRTLYEQGYRGIIFDIDNTLVPHGAPADEKIIKLFNDNKIKKEYLNYSDRKSTRLNSSHRT